MENLPLVSICCITYNHEKYISQAIDSFLMQETDFDVEIVIGDDCSSDATPLIIEEYRQKFPEKFRILKREKNLGSEVNFIKTIEACRGTYVALCEGDDYWIDPQKLRIQIDGLERFQSASICVTNFMILDEEKKVIEPNIYPEDEDSFEIVRFDKSSIFKPFRLQTNTIVFRKKMIRPSFFLQSKIGDVFLCAELLCGGEGIYLPLITCVYRKHEKGIFSKKRNIEKYKLEYERSKRMNKYFRGNYKEINNLHKWCTEKYKAEVILTSKSKIKLIFDFYWLFNFSELIKIFLGSTHKIEVLQTVSKKNDPKK